MSDSPSMGCKVPHNYCTLCDQDTGPCEHIKSQETAPLRFFALSVVSFTDEDIGKVAAHAGVSEEQIRQYIQSDEQNRELFRAVEFITGCCPMGKR